MSLIANMSIWPNGRLKQTILLQILKTILKNQWWMIISATNLTELTNHSLPPPAAPDTQCKSKSVKRKRKSKEKKLYARSTYDDTLEFHFQATDDPLPSIVKLWKCGMPEGWKNRMPVCRNAGMPECRRAGMPEYRNVGI